MKKNNPPGNISPEDYKAIKKRVQDIIDLLAYVHPGFTIVKVGQVLLKAVRDIDAERKNGEKNGSKSDRIGKKENRRIGTDRHGARRHSR